MLLLGNSPDQITNRPSNYLPPATFRRFKLVDEQLEDIERRVASLEILRSAILENKLLPTYPIIKKTPTKRWKEYDYNEEDVRRFEEERQKRADELQEMLSGKRDFDFTPDDVTTIGFVCRGTKKGLQYACPQCWQFHYMHHEGDE